MRITLESTSRLVYADGIETRLREGATENGTPVEALICRIAVRKTEDLAAFEQELRETRTPEPSPASQAFPLRLIL